MSSFGLDAGELRIGLGCMRLSTDADRDEERGLDTIAAAADSGVTVFDTARMYARGPHELGHNERLLARALRRSRAEGRARIVTKGGMTRLGAAWVPDGRARTIRADCEASLVALDGLPIDLFLLHAPDPRTPWRTSVRALRRLVDDGLVRRVGLSNVNRGQVEEALGLAPIAAVQVALSPFDDRALRGGVVDRCEEAGIVVIAHSPLGGPRRAGRLARHEALTAVASARGASVAEVALALLLDLSPAVIAIPGARRPETARSAARAAAFELADSERELLAAVLARSRPSRRTARPAEASDLVLVMGIAGAGKTQLAEEYVAHGYQRLNRDERGGSLRALEAALDDALASGARRIVLDNTYVTRAARSRLIETAARHDLPLRCVWLDTPLAQAQVNLVQRLIDLLGRLPAPEELRKLARSEQGVLAPTSQMRMLRELEPPSPDEGFSAVERVAFSRAQAARELQPGVFVAATALSQPGWEVAIAAGDTQAPHLVFDWDPEGSSAVARAADALSARVRGRIETAACPHPGGPPICWCRPPLPGLPLVFARTHTVDPATSTLIGTSPAHRTLATTLGARLVEV